MAEHRVTILGYSFGLDHDFAEDTGPSWTWIDRIALCPRCLEQRGKAVPLVPHGQEKSRIATVTPEQRISCASCDWLSDKVTT